MPSGYENDNCETSTATDTISTSSSIPIQSLSSLIAKAFAVSALKVAAPSDQRAPVSQDNGSKVSESESIQSRTSPSQTSLPLHFSASTAASSSGSASASTPASTASAAIAPVALAASDSYLPNSVSALPRLVFSSLPPLLFSCTGAGVPPGGGLPTDSGLMRRPANAELDSILDEMQGEYGARFLPCPYWFVLFLFSCYSQSGWCVSKMYTLSRSQFLTL